MKLKTLTTETAKDQRRDLNQVYCCITRRKVTLFLEEAPYGQSVTFIRRRRCITASGIQSPDTHIDIPTPMLRCHSFDLMSVFVLQNAFFHAKVSNKSKQFIAWCQSPI